MSLATGPDVVNENIGNLPSRQASAGDGIVRRTTAEALELITGSESQKLSYSVWYEPGKDFCFYATAFDACRNTKKRLNELKLKDEELESIKYARGLDVLMQRIQQTVEVQEKASKRHAMMNKAGHFVDTFCEFVTRTSGIIELLVPQSPEYRMTYGALLLLFKSVYKRKETQESLMIYITTLSARLPIVDFYGKVYPSNGMKIQVVSIYVEILNLLNEAIVYYRSNRLRQLRDAVLRPVETKFDQCIQRIDAEIDKLLQLKDAAQAAHQSGIKEFLESTGQVVGRLHDNLQNSMAAFSSCLALIDSRIEKIAQQSSSMHNFQAVNHALALTEVLLPSASTADEQLSFVRKQHFDLSPKDHWYETDVVKFFDNWSAYGWNHLLWVGGRSGNQDTWITEMSIDLVDVLRMQDLTLLHAFYDMRDEPFTVKILIKRLIGQLLDRHPEIAFGQPRKYSIQRFRNAKTFLQLWTIFELLICELTSNVFILIDRIEGCSRNSDLEGSGDAAGNVSHELLPCLMGLASDMENVSVIVTSTYEPPKSRRGGEMSYFYQDTRKSRGKREK